MSRELKEVREPAMLTSGERMVEAEGKAGKRSRG